MEGMTKKLLEGLRKKRAGAMLADHLYSLDRKSVV